MILTVYVTNYNYGKYIEQAIESLLSQTFTDFDIIIIDDGSTDNSKEIIEKYSSNEKISIIYQKNRGLNVSNNLALRLAKGRYIMRLDADDYLENNALEKMVLKLESDPKLGLVFPDYFYINAEGKALGKEQRHVFSKEVSMLDQPAHGACTMIRAQFLRDLGGYDESFTCQDGYDLWIKFITEHKVDNINEPLFSYRQHGSNLTRNEERILSTRAQIKQAYLSRKGHKVPESIIIIPVRDQNGNKSSTPFMKVAEKTLLQRRIEAGLESKHIKNIVVSSSDRDIVKILDEYEDTRIIFHFRKEELARYNKDLKFTVNDILDNSNLLNKEPGCILISPLEFPFISGKEIDDAIHTMILFDADSIVAVRNENNMIFQHHGEGMKPILNQDGFTKLEREMLYKNSGAIMLSRLESFRKNNSLLGKRIGHIMLSQKAAWSIKTDFDFKVAEFLALDES